MEILGFELNYFTKCFLITTDEFDTPILEQKEDNQKYNQITGISSYQFLEIDTPHVM